MTRKRLYGHYARIMIDLDLSSRLPNEIMVEREDFAFYVIVEYEKLPGFCAYCQSIRHTLQNCSKKGDNLITKKQAPQKKGNSTAQIYVPKGTVNPALDKNLNHNGNNGQPDSNGLNDVVVDNDNHVEDHYDGGGDHQVKDLNVVLVTEEVAPEQDNMQQDNGHHQNTNNGRHMEDSDHESMETVYDETLTNLQDKDNAEFVPESPDNGSANELVGSWNEKQGNHKERTNSGSGEGSEPLHNPQVLKEVRIASKF